MEAGDVDLGPFASHLGLQLVEATGDRVLATWQGAPHLHQPYGIVHGGVHCSVVETLGSVGAMLWLGDGAQVVGVANQTDFFRAARDESLTSTATPVHRGRSQQVWEVATTDQAGHLVARGQLRLHNLRVNGDSTPR